jgi:hypothetical protein
LVRGFIYNFWARRLILSLFFFSCDSVVSVDVGNYVANEALNILEVDAFPLIVLIDLGAL